MEMYGGGEKGENLPAHAMQADADIYLTTKIRFVVFPVEIRNHMFMDKVSRTRGYDIPPPSTTKWKWIKGAIAQCHIQGPAKRRFPGCENSAGKSRNKIFATWEPPFC